MRLVGASLLCLILACSESFLPASAVTDFRVVAAKVEVRGDPSRANPSPGQGLQVSILSIDQGAPPSDIEGVPSLTPALLRWELVPCIPLPVTIGPPVCFDPIEPCEGCEGPPESEPLETPLLRFTAPSEAELAQAEATAILLQGVVCSNGTPNGEAILRFLSGESDDLEPCGEPALIPGVPIEGRFVAATIPIEQEPSDPNLNPVVQNVLLDGATWPPPYDQGVPRTAPGTGCAADLEGLSEQERGAQPRAGDSSSTIDLSVTQDSLQTFTVDGEAVTEEIQVSWLADGGGFEASFSFISDFPPSALIQWQPPTSVADDGELVRFAFVVRDGRGGLDWVERGLCILPPEPDAFPP